MTDCAFRTDEGRFYYCVRAVIIRSGKLLAMRDENAPYYYLPGGKVAMGESAEEAVLRELKEELSVEAEIIRALWFAQSFYTEKVKNERYHELGIYYLVKIPDNAFTENEKTMREGKHILRFEWLPLNAVKEKYLYPEFIKTAVVDLPDALKTVIERR